LSENVVLLIANILVILAWIPTALFVTFYALFSPWHRSLIGKTLMYFAIAMLVLLTYSLTARWLVEAPDLNYALGLAAYAFLTAMLWLLFISLRAAQTGRVTPERPDWTPIRDWLRHRRTKKES
jgi:hypothetical protein